MRWLEPGSLGAPGQSEDCISQTLMWSTGLVYTVWGITRKWPYTLKNCTEEWLTQHTLFTPKAETPEKCCCIKIDHNLYCMCMLMYCICILNAVSKGAKRNANSVLNYVFIYLFNYPPKPWGLAFAVFGFSQTIAVLHICFLFCLRTSFPCMPIYFAAKEGAVWQ